MTPTIATLSLLYLVVVTAPRGSWQWFADEWGFWCNVRAVLRYQAGLREAEKRKANEKGMR